MIAAPKNFPGEISRNIYLKISSWNGRIAYSSSKVAREGIFSGVFSLASFNKYRSALKTTITA
jgi:hypothetical protein